MLGFLTVVLVLLFVLLDTEGLVLVTFLRVVLFGVTLFERSFLSTVAIL